MISPKCPKCGGVKIKVLEPDKYVRIYRCKNKDCNHKWTAYK